MSLKTSTIQGLKQRRQRILDGGVNTIPSPFRRFSKDFLGWEQATYYIITSYTKGGKTQLASHLIFDAILWCYYNGVRADISLKVLYFPLEETKERIMTRFFSWLLYRLYEVRISPSDLRSSDNENPLSQEILNLMESEEFTSIADYWESCILFSEESNPTGIYKFCKKYAEEHGKTIYKAIKIKDELGFEKSVEVFDHYEPDNPNEYVLVLIDTVNMIELERGYNKKQAIDKLSEYAAKYMRNRYGQSPVLIQQQNTDNESVDSIKLNRTRPTIAGLGDSKYTAHDANIALGIYSPFKFGQDSYLEYDIKKFKDHFRTLEVLVNRDGELGGIIGLFFDGATCSWYELPKPNNTEEMGQVYAHLRRLNPSNSFSIHSLRKLVNPLRGNLKWFTFASRKEKKK